MSRSIPLIVKQMLSNYEISMLSDNEQRAWKDRFKSLAAKGGLSALDQELNPLEKELIKHNQETQTLKVEARNILSGALDKMEEAAGKLLWIRVESGTLTGKKYSYKWHEQVIENVNSLSENDRKILDGLNEAEREICMHTSAKIAALDAKKARIKDVLKIAERVKDDYFPKGIDTIKKDGRKNLKSDDQKEIAQKYISNYRDVWVTEYNREQNPFVKEKVIPHIIKKLNISKKDCLSPRQLCQTLNWNKPK